MKSASEGGANEKVWFPASSRSNGTRSRHGIPSLRRNRFPQRWPHRLAHSISGPERSTSTSETQTQRAPYYARTRVVNVDLQH